MAAGVAYPPELKSRAVRLVLEAKDAEPDSSWNAIYRRIGNQLSVHPTSLRAWVRQNQIDEGKIKGTTTSDAKEIKELKRKVRELERANEILLAASSFFARELDPRLPW